MGVSGNGSAPPPEAGKERRPRRLVLLRGDAQSEVRQVLAEYAAGGIKGSHLHGELQKLAGEHPGALVAAEWHGPLGWTRFLWCSRPTPP